MKATRRHLLLLVAGASAGIGARAQTTGAQRVAVRGDVLRPLQLDRAELAAFPADDQATSSVMRRVDNQERQTATRGVRLRAILRPARRWWCSTNATARRSRPMGPRSR